MAEAAVRAGMEAMSSALDEAGPECQPGVMPEAIKQPINAWVDAGATCLSILMQLAAGEEPKYTLNYTTEVEE